MPIVNKTFDSWGTRIGERYSGLYFYALNNTLIESNNDVIMGFAPCIQSIVYNPFFNIDKFNLNKIKFDIAYFGDPGGSTPYVYRIAPLSYSMTESLGSYNLTTNKPDINSRSWQNESKLQMAPYTYYTLCDFFNTPLEIEAQGLQNKNGVCNIYVMYTLSNRGSYNLYVDGYKGDNIGNIYGLINESALDIPVLSSAYSQFLATSKNSFKTNVSNQLNMNNVNKSNNNTNYQLSMINNLASALSQGSLLSRMSGALTSGINSGANYQMQENVLNATAEQITSSALSQVQDLESSPRGVVSTGNDALFSMANSRYKLQLIKYGLSGDGYTRLANYFALYGYKQNKFMNINYRNRYYYNYVKTLDCNIYGFIPKEPLKELKDIFNKGVTIWHLDRVGVEVFNYSNDNREVY